MAFSKKLASWDERNPSPILSVVLSEKQEDPLASNIKPGLD